MEESDGKKENTSLRKIKSATTPPMATRRRSKLEAKKPPVISEIDKIPSSMEEHRPKSASSDEAGLFLTESTSFQNDILVTGLEDPDKKSTHNLYPVTAISKDERLRSFLNVFVGLPVSISLPSRFYHISKSADFGCTNREVRAFATETLDSGLIPGWVKPKTIKIGIHRFSVTRSDLKGTV